MVRDLWVDPPQFYCIANSYWPPMAVRGQAGPVKDFLRYMDDLGVDILVGDLNARHYDWCPAVPRTILTADTSQNDGAHHRGSQIAQYLPSIMWVVSNDRNQPTRWAAQGGAAAQPTSPDVVLHTSSLSSTFRVFTGANAGECVARCTRDTIPEERMRAVSDHMPIFIHFSSRERHFVPLLSRCPVVLYDKVKDWTPAQTSTERWLSTYTRPLRDAKDHFGRVSAMLRHVMKQLPQRSRKSSATRLPPMPQQPDALAQLGARATVLFHQGTPEALAVVRDYREQHATWLGQLRLYQFLELLRSPTRGAEWTRELWSLVRAKGVLLPPTLSYPGTTKPMGARHMAEAFADAFATKHAVSTDPACVTLCRQCVEDIVSLAPAADAEHLPVSVAEIQLALRALRGSQSADDVGVRPVLLRNLPPPALNAIADLLTATLRESYVPEAWRESQVIPLYKGHEKPRSEVTSYRPVAITNLLCRVMEHIVKARVLHGMELAGAPLHPQQYGFRPGLSSEFCLAQIISSLREGSRYVYVHSQETKSGMTGQRHYHTLAVAVDFTDAFCRVPTEVVVRSLYRRKVPGELVRWIQAFLTDRQIRVFVQGRFAAKRATAVGCPQGSVLGPLLWALAMDDLLEELATFVSIMEATKFTSLNQRTLFAPSSDDLIRTIRKVSETIRFADGDKERCKEPFTVTPANPGPGAACGFAAYADDLTIWAHWLTPLLTAAAVQAMLDIISAWADKMGVQVSSKTCGSWFKRGSLGPMNLTRPLALRLDTRGTTIAIPPLGRSDGSRSAWETGIPVLGVYLDAMLTFEEHVRRTTMQATELSSRLHYVTRAMPPGLLSVVQGSLVGSRLLYGLAAYWHAASARTKDTLRKAWHSMALTITGALPSAREALVLAEAGRRSLSYMAFSKSLQLLFRAISLPPETYGFCTRPFYFQLEERTDPRLLPHSVPHSYVGPWLVDDFLRPPRVECWRDWIAGHMPTGALQSRMGVLRALPLATVVGNLPKVRFRCATTLDGVRMPPKRLAGTDLLHRFNVRQLQLDPDCHSVDMCSDGSVEGMKESGGAFIVLDSGGTELTRGTLSLGEGACSYSMERASMRAGVVALYSLLTTQQRRVPLVRVVTDSLSVLEELSLGPFRQCEEECEDIWAKLLTMPADEVRLVFVYSHVEGAADHSLTDKLAAAARSATATQPRWPQDVLRGRLLQEREVEDAPIVGSIRGSLDIRGPSRDLMRLRLTRAQHRELIRLRTGACPRLGGWQHQVDHCTFCDCPISRESMATDGVESAVRHLFGVPGVSGCWYLPPPGVTVKDLWDRPRVALSWLESYLQHPRESYNGMGQAARAPYHEDFGPQRR